MCSCRGGALGSRMVQRHVVRVPHHGRRLTAVKAGHACRADQTLDRPCVVQDHLRVASCLPVRLTTQQFDGPVRHGHARPPASRSSALRFKGRGPSRLARILRSHSAARSVKPTGSPRQVAVVQVRDQNMCRKRSFATGGRGRLPASAVVPARDEQGRTAHRPQILLVERLLEQGVRAARHWVRRRGLAGVGDTTHRSRGRSHGSATASTETIRTRLGQRRWRSETPWTSARMRCTSLGP